LRPHLGAGPVLGDTPESGADARNSAQPMDKAAAPCGMFSTRRLAHAAISP
jgi:hypothetical protein